MSSEQIKNAVMDQVLNDVNSSNLAQLMTSVYKTCFEKCFHSVGSSVSRNEEACSTSCIDKYIATWNLTNAVYVKRLVKENITDDDN